MSLQCPKCQQTIPIDGEAPPKELLCSSCGSAFVEATGESVGLIKKRGSETVTFHKDDDDTAVTYVPVSLPPKSSAEPDRPEHFGAYELQEEIARGGMGVVYKARQTKLNRICALKMILAGQLAGKDDITRFHTEAAAAANLDHPNIVPVYEVGEENGQHYYSMGLVEGESLAEQLKEGPLKPREAAELAKTLAAAIAYAHERGVIHRDLKPGNVLLDADGKPRITDFGLAKRTEADNELTATGQIIGTPSYMPPEQASGKIDQVGPPADIYSLGAMLYATLTGRPPFQASGVMETLQQVLDREPVAPRTLNPAVDKDLETICLKCLQKDASGRYDSASALADDLSRFLDGKPIAARPVGRFERSWRWCRRNRALAIVGGTALLLMLTLAIGGPLVAVNQARLREAETTARSLAEANEQDARRAQKQATENYKEARETIDKYVETVQNAELLKDARFKTLLRKLLKDAMAHYKAFIRKHEHDESAQADLAESVFIVGAISHRSGDKDAAISAYREAISLTERLLSQNPSTIEYRLRLAGCHSNIGVLYLETGNPSDALSAYQQALRILERLARDNPDVAEHRYNLARSHNNIGNLYSRTGRHPEALAAHQQALRIREQLVRDHPTVTKYRNSLATSHANLGTFYTHVRKPLEALAAFQQALDIWKQLVRDNPLVTEYRNKLGRTYTDVGILQMQFGKPSEALAAHQQGLKIQSQLAQDNPTVTDYQNKLANSYSSIGNLYSQTGNSSAALAAYQQSLSIHERLARAYPTVTSYRVFLAGSHVNIVSVTVDVSSAMEHLRRAISLLGPVLKSEPQHSTARLFLRNAHIARATVLERQQQYEQAASDWRQASRFDSGPNKATFESRAKVAMEKAGK